MYLVGGCAPGWGCVLLGGGCAPRWGDGGVLPGGGCVLPGGGGVLLGRGCALRWRGVTPKFFYYYSFIFDF